MNCNAAKKRAVMQYKEIEQGTSLEMKMQDC
jgi:hypothetical protein